VLFGVGSTKRWRWASKASRKAWPIRDNPRSAGVEHRDLVRYCGLERADLQPNPAGTAPAEAGSTIETPAPWATRPQIIANNSEVATTFRCAPASAKTVATT